MQKPAHNQEENLTQGNRPTKQQRTRTARIISRPRETTTLSNLGSSIREALKISACENTSTCLHASRNQLLLSPNLDAASMLQEIKDRQSLKDFPKTKMLYTENKTLPRSIFHNRFTWPRAYNPPSASEIPFILGHSCSSQTRSCSDMVGLIYLSARIRRPTISSTDFSCCNSVSTVEPAADFSLQSQGTLKPETQTEPCPSSSSVKAPKNEPGGKRYAVTKRRFLSLSLQKNSHAVNLANPAPPSQPPPPPRQQPSKKTDEQRSRRCANLSPHHDRRLLSSLKRKISLLRLLSSSSSTEPPLLVKRSKA